MNPCWYVKDFADGWIKFDDLNQAANEVIRTGAIIQYSLDGKPPEESPPHSSEWFFRWIARGKAGYAGMTMEQCINTIWCSPENPYSEVNPWETPK